MSNLAFEREVRPHSSDRRHDRCQEVQGSWGAVVSDLVFEREVRVHSSDRRHDCCQEVQEGSWVRTGRKHRSLKIDRNFECKIRAAGVAGKPAWSGSRSHHC